MSKTPRSVHSSSRRRRRRHRPVDRLVAGQVGRPASQTGTAGGNAGTSTWTVVATKHVTTGNFGVSGTVSITNDNMFAVPFFIANSLDDGTGIVVGCPSLSVPADSSLECTFTASPTNASATKVTALVTPTDGILGAQQATAAVSFATHLIGDETVTVDDDRDTDGQFPAQISGSTHVHATTRRSRVPPTRRTTPTPSIPTRT